MTKLSNDARALVELARVSDGPSDQDRHLVRAGLAASGAALALSATAQATAHAAATLGSAAATHTALAAAPAAATGLSALTAHVIAPGIIGMALGAAVAGPVLLRDRAPEPRSVPVRAPIVTSAPVSPTAPRTGPQAPVTAPAPPNAQPLPSALHRATETDSLQRETELLVRAQRELSSGRSESALELIEQHERHFPRGSLAQERAAARVFALCRAGRPLEARAHAQRFLRTAPASPVAPRIRRSCAFAETPSEGTNGNTDLPADDHSASEELETSP